VLTPEQGIAGAILVCLIGAALALALAHNRRTAGWAAFVATSISGLFVINAVVCVLADGPSTEPAQFLQMPLLGFALRLHVDGLSAVFLLLAVLVAVATAMYGISYMDHYPEYNVRRYYPYFLLFLAAMYGLLTTTDMMWFFFIFWQMMTLPGYALIRYEHRIRQNVIAANKYMLMMQIACVATMAGAELLVWGEGSVSATGGLKYDFETVKVGLPTLLEARPVTAALAFALFLAGFGIKMGMWPFGQFWLPDAHPAAPSPVSAMLSGVMIKTGAYGLMRYFIWLPADGGTARFHMGFWGALVVALGTITLFTGAAQALKQEQSKRLLAFSSIGQIGYIMLGTGACMALLATGDSSAGALAIVGFTGALFHVLNHGCFKALLFLNAGSLIHATGTQDLNRMGGLMRFMPVTAVTALVGSLSISGVPLLNGFASKWHIYVACIQGSASVRYLAVCGLVAIFTSAITLALFIKFYGASFASRSSAQVRDRLAARGRLEVGTLMQLPQVFLALTCILLGMWPTMGTGLLAKALRMSHSGLLGDMAGATGVSRGAWSRLTAADGSAQFAPAGLAGLLIGGLFVAVLIGRAGGAKRRSAEPWLCGYARQSEHNRYRAHGYYWELKRLVARVGGGQSKSAICAHQNHSFMGNREAWESSTRDSQKAGFTGEKTPDPEMPVWSVIEEKAKPNRGPESHGGSDGDR